MMKHSHIEQLIHSLCPNGIEYLPLGKVCDIINGYAFQSEKYCSQGIRVIRISDVQKGYISDKDVKYYPQELVNEYKSCVLRESDIVMSLTGNCGRVAAISKSILPAALNQRVACLRAKESVNHRYLFHYLHQDQFENEAMESAHGAGQKNLSTIWLSQYLIPIPPISIQDEIARILDAFYDLILNIDKEIEERQNQYSIASAHYLNSTKHNWHKDTLHNLGKFFTGLSGKTKDDFSEGNAKFVTYKNVYFNPAIDLDIKDFVKVSPDERQNSIQYGDVLFTGSSETPDECAISSVVNKQIKEQIYLNSFCFGFRFNDLTGIFIDFYKHYFRSAEIRSYALKSSHGTTRFNVSKAEFGTASIPLPSLKEQQAIAAKLDTIEAFIANLNEERTLRQQQYEYYRAKLISLLK